MNTTSAKQLIEDIEKLTLDYFPDFIKKVKFEKYNNADSDKELPMLSYYYSENPFQLNLGVDTVSLDFEILDLETTQEDENQLRKEVVSDCFYIASMLVKAFMNQDISRFEYPVPISKVDAKTNNGLGGVSFTIVFAMNKASGAINKCN